VADELVLALTYPHRLLLLIDIANLRDDGAAKWFWNSWGTEFRSESMSEKGLVELRNQLRQIWQEPTSGCSELIVKEWLNSRTSKEHPEFPFTCSIRLSKFIPNWGLRAMLIQGILEHWEHFRFCANGSCAAPYFVAKRRDQTICDAGDCKAEKQRQHALKWWRANRANSPSKTKQRSERNGTRKTR
jgi:hypothetical protein